MRPLFLTAAALTIALIFWTTREHGISSPQPLLSDVTAQHARIAPPSGAQPSSVPEATTKVGSVLVSSRYLVTGPYESVRKYYRGELSRAGWTYHRTLGSSENRVDV